MPGQELRIVRNSKRIECSNCEGVHEYITRPSQHAPCGTPIAYPKDKANSVAQIMALGPDDVVKIPTDTRVVINDEDRTMPKHPEPDLARFTTRERFA